MIYIYIYIYACILYIYTLTFFPFILKLRFYSKKTLFKKTVIFQFVEKPSQDCINKKDKNYI